MTPKVQVSLKQWLELLLHIQRPSRSQWPRGLRRRSAAPHLLRLWVRIPPGEWLFVLCECCVLTRRGLCDELISRPEESCRLWCVVLCDLETSIMRRPWPSGGYCAKKQTIFKVSRVPVMFQGYFEDTSCTFPPFCW